MRKPLTLLILALLAACGSLSAQGFTDILIRHDDGRVRRPSVRHRVQPIRVKKHHVDVAVDGNVARTTVKQVFFNPNRLVLEGTYVFPIPERASLTDFTMVMNGQVVHGEVLEKEKARGIYEGIVRSMRDPALLEYVGQGLFRARVFPIPAGGPVEVTLTYVERLVQDAGVVEYRYPLRTQPFSDVAVESLAVTATIKSSSIIKSAFSSSHKVDVVAKGEHETRVSFEGRQRAAKRDFHLLYTLSDQSLGLHVLTDHSHRDGGFFMMTLSPKARAEARKAAPKDVVFVLDTSGSMREDEKIDQAKKALTYGLGGLNPDDRFGIVTFSTEARRYAETLSPVTPESMAEAMKWVGEIRAAGGTNIHEALQMALAGESEERLRMVVFLTDGLPTIGETDVARIVAAARKRNVSQSRLFVFGVGYDVNTRLLDLLAEQNRGARDYVTPSGNLELELGRFFDKIAHPALSNPRVAIDGATITDMYPKVLPDIFHGTEVVVFGRYEGAGMKAVRLFGTVGDKAVEFVHEARFAEKSTGRDFIPVLWARRKVGYLMDQIRLNGENGELRDEVVRLGKKYGIATPYTSFLVTEDGAAPIGGGGGADFRRFFDAPPAPGASPPVPSKAGAPEGSSAPGDQGRGAVDRSLRSKRLREAGRALLGGAVEVEELDDHGVVRDAASPKVAEVKVRRVKGRTFHQRGDVWIDVALDELTAEEREAAVEKVTAYSARYFELVRKHPDLAKTLATMPRLMIKVGDAVYWFLQAKVEPVGGSPGGR